MARMSLLTNTSKKAVVTKGRNCTATTPTLTAARKLRSSCPAGSEALSTTAQSNVSTVATWHETETASSLASTKGVKKARSTSASSDSRMPEKICASEPGAMKARHEVRSSLRTSSTISHHHASGSYFWKSSPYFRICRSDR